MVKFCQNAPTTTFVDLATLSSSIAAKLYCTGANAITYMAKLQHCITPGAQTPISLSQTGTADFGQEATWTYTRASDYAWYAWLRCTLPAVSVNTSAAALAGADLDTLRIRWTPKVGHALINRACLTANEVSMHEFPGYYLDFWAAFTVPASKAEGYANMIGDVPQLNGTLPGTGPVPCDPLSLPSWTLNVPLPWFHARNNTYYQAQHKALPMAALPYNEIKATIEFRNLSELLIAEYDTTAEVPVHVIECLNPAWIKDASTLRLTNVCYVVNYITVSNEERKKMGCANREYLIEQVQELKPFSITPSTSPTFSNITIPFNFPIRFLMFGVRNVTNPCEHGNYTTLQSFMPATALDTLNGACQPAYLCPGSDPFASVDLSYEGTYKLQTQPPDFFSLVQPYFHAVSVPVQCGYHLYSYGLNIYSYENDFSTNYSKLTNVTLSGEYSADAIALSAGANAAVLNALAVGASTKITQAQKYKLFVLAHNFNILRVAGGTTGFPVL
jgi:hypothetical protein